MAMVSPLVYSQLALLALLWLFVMFYLTGSKPGRTTPPVPAQPKRKRSTEPKAFEPMFKGLLRSVPSKWRCSQG